MTRRDKRELTETEKLQDEVRTLRQTLGEYEKSLARSDPAAVLKRLPETIDDYGDDLPDRVLALAAIGMFTREIRAELGITEQNWASWRTAHPRFFAATQRARDLAGAYWYGMARRSLEWKDWKLPYNQLIVMIKAMQEDDSASDRGDASQLVIVDVANGREAMKAKQA